MSEAPSKTKTFEQSGGGGGGGGGTEEERERRRCSVRHLCLGHPLPPLLTRFILFRETKVRVVRVVSYHSLRTPGTAHHDGGEAEGVEGGVDAPLLEQQLRGLVRTRQRGQSMQA